MKRMAGVIMLLVLLGAYPVFADTVDLFESPAPSFQVTSMVRFDTTGNEMGGMRVTATFLGGGSETRTWVNGGGATGGVTGTGWSITETGTTFSSNWTLSNPNTTITRLTFDGFPGGTVFDRTFGGATGTPDSALGADFRITSPDQGLDVDATYLSLVGVGANPPVGDIFRGLDLVFNDLRGFSGGMTFVADTDNAVVPGVPEPATMLLLGSGLIGLAGFARKKFRKNN